LPKQISFPLFNTGRDYLPDKLMSRRVRKS
jgi:hypothetical protein